MLPPQSGIGRNPSPNNPYQDHSSQYVRPWEPPEPAVVTLRDLDRMVAARLGEARKDAAEAQRMACLEAWELGREEGHRAGIVNGRDIVRREVKEVINRRLNHTMRKLSDDWTERRKTTIAAEREYMAKMARELAAAINALENA